MAYNRVKKPRFYIDVTNLVRAKGGIYDYQPTVIADNGVPWIPAHEMFHNNGTKNWKTDMFEGWKQNGADISIDVTSAWSGDNGSYEETFTNNFWQTDLYMRFSQYYPLSVINYMGFLGHNLGPSLSLVEPFICKSDNNGINESEVPLLTLDDVLEEPTSPNHFFGSADYVDGRFEFFRFQGHGDPPPNDPHFVCDIDPLLTEEECEDAGGNWIDENEQNRDGEDINLEYTSADIGWNIFRFNDNNKSDDTFHQIWNVLGDEQMINKYNTMGLRVYKYDGNATYINSTTQWRKCPHINSFTCGWTYVMENTPDLEIEQTWEFDGIKTKTGMGGQNITNINYDGPAGWQFLVRNYDADGVVGNSFNINESTAWHHHSSGAGTEMDGFGGQHGRRVWKLKFSYMNDFVDSRDRHNSIFGSAQFHNTGLFNDNQHRESKVHLEWGSSSHGTPGDAFIGINKNFFSRVVQGTMGGKLPFLFQPDSEDNDEIYLCEFEGNEISFEQVAPNVYNFDLTIREIW